MFEKYVGGRVVVKRGTTNCSDFAVFAVFLRELCVKGLPAKFAKESQRTQRDS
jgi:hypothetical protein